MVEDTGCDGVELNFGCPHGMSERGMGSAVGQVPEYIEMVARWCKQLHAAAGDRQAHAQHHRHPPPGARRQGRRRRRGVPDQHHQLDHGRRPATRMTHEPDRRRQGLARRLLRPGGQADRAEHGGRDRARPGHRAACRSRGIGGITTWRDAAEFIALGAGTVQVCTAAMVYGFKIVQDMCDGLSNFMDEKGYAQRRRDRRPGRAQRHRLEPAQPEPHREGRHRPGPVHPVRPLPRRLRGHLAPGHHARRRTASATSR